jgi:hypothetical protein
MTIRSPVLTLAVACTVVLAGCAAVPGFGDEECGPGETAIDDVEDGANVTVTGTLQSINETSVVIDDGTGTALLVTDRTFNTSVASPEGCVTASGTGVNDTDSNRYNATILVGNVTIET